MPGLFRWYDYFTYNVYYFGLTAISQTMAPLVLPLLVQEFVGRASQGKYYGTIRLWSLMAALLTQALVGILSDRSTSRWGRRRPFIFVGTLGAVLTFILMGYTANQEGMQGYWFLFSLIILQMVMVNTAQAGQQGIIPDLVPTDQRGRFSAIKALFEIPLPAIIVAFTIGRMIGSGNLWGGLIVLILFLLVVMSITMFVQENAIPKTSGKFEWKSLHRTLVMTGSFAGMIILTSKALQLLINLVAPLTGFTYLFAIAAGGLLGIAGVVVMGVVICIRLAVNKSELESENKTFISAYTWWVVSRLAYLVGATNLVSFTIYFLQGNFGFDGAAAARPTANLTMVVGVFIMLAAIPAGRLTDRFGWKPLLIFSGYTATAGALVVILSPPSMALLYVGGSLLGFATGIFYTANWALGTIIVPQAQAGKYLGISNLAGAGAGAIGAYIGGPIADAITTHPSSSVGAGYSVIFAVFGLLFLVSLLSLRGIPQTKTK